MWLTPGRASGYKKVLQCSSLTLLKKEYYEEEVQPHRSVHNGSPGSTRFYGPVHLRRHWSVYTREASEIFKLSGC